MITTASPAHLDGIRKLWQEAFGDSIEYINMFLGQKAELQNTLVCLDGGTVTGMLFILPCSLVIHQASYPCAYLYGIATLQEARGRGIGTLLTQEAYHLCNRRGYAACVLEPATPSLFDFYQKIGFVTQGYIKTLTVRAPDPDTAPASIDLAPIDHDEVSRIRRAFFAPSFLEWDSKALAYAGTECKHQGGSFLRFDLCGQQGYLCCVPQHDTLLIKELAGSDSLLPELVKALHGLYHKQTYHIRLHPAAAVGTLTPFAMIRWIAKGTDGPFYHSLGLD